MAVSRALRRLLRIRELEEEQNRLALESALGELNRLEYALEATIERGRQGRRLVLASAQSGQVMDRIAGFEETRSAGSHEKALAPRIHSKQMEVATRRQEFLLKRIERRQAETLIEESEAQDALEADRRGQQSLDDWYGSQSYRRTAEESMPKQAAAKFATQIFADSETVSPERRET
jgi:hypothetical protein